MKILEQKILKDGKILGGDILKVDNFLNHQMDVALFNELGRGYIYALSRLRSKQDFNHRGFWHRVGLYYGAVF